MVKNRDLCHIFTLSSILKYTQISHQITVVDLFCIQSSKKHGQIRNPRAILSRDVLNQNLKPTIFRDFRASTFQKIPIFGRTSFKVLTAESQKPQILYFWISTCQRKITRGFRI